MWEEAGPRTAHAERATDLCRPLSLCCHVLVRRHPNAQKQDEVPRGDMDKIEIPDDQVTTLDEIARV